MQKNKAGGLSGATVDMLIHAPPAAITKMSEIVNSVITNHMYPKLWQSGLLKLIYKGSGDPEDDKNYRPIQLTEAMFRLTETILWRRLQPFLDKTLRDEQGGFRPHRGTLEQLFILSTLIDLATKREKPIFLAFMDIQKAFDSADHDSIIFKLGLKGADRSSCHLLRSIISHHQSVLDSSVDPIDILCGVLQGGILSPGLFDVFIDDIISKEISDQYGVHLTTLSVATLLFADDTVLASESSNGLQHLLDIVHQWSLDWGITFNPSKCAILILGRNRPKSVPQFTLGNASLSVVDSATVLGITFHSHHAPVREVHSKVSEKLQKLAWILRGNVPVPTRFASTIWTAKLAPSLLYGSEVFPLSPNATKVQRQAARTILGAPMNTSSAAMFEFLSWARVETSADIRCLRFANRLKNHFSPLIQEAFQLNLEM
ncbi:MAG TPA: reverse transcriptase family protein, partial [Pseudothermotoga sp.]